MNRFLVFLLFILVACLASADRVNRDLETRLLEIEGRIERIEHRIPAVSPFFPNYPPVIISTYCTNLLDVKGE